jgi:hypothetical protein
LIIQISFKKSFLTPSHYNNNKNIIMVKDPSERMIPSDTKLTEDQYKILDGAIAWRRKDARKCGMEESLWLIGEINHIRALKEYNKQFHER